MPYIKKETRVDIDLIIEELNKYLKTEGDFNYAITKLLHRHIEKDGLNYANINKVIGILECAKLELYRIVAGTYEDIKKEENGSVSSLDKPSPIKYLK